VAEKADHADQREKLSMMNPEHRKLLEQEMVSSCSKVKTCTSKAIRRRKNNSGGLTPPQANTTRTPGMMKKFLALALDCAVACFVFSSKKGDDYNEAWVKDTNGFDILMGQFAHNIENIWGFNEVLIAGPKDYVKYTDVSDP
jgi:membrane-bound lytic murein transglycosylase C